MGPMAVVRNLNPEMAEMPEMPEGVMVGDDG